MEALHTTCRFCDHSGREGGGASVDDPWLSADQHFAMVSKGALVPGWTVVCPISHKLNLATEYTSQSFWRFADNVAAVVGNRYGDVQVFEHGPSVANSMMGCGTDHAHLHVVPLPFNLFDEVQIFDPLSQWLPCNVADITNHTHGREYLFVSNNCDGAQTSGMLCLPASATSQFFRRVIARKLGIADLFDYRIHPMLKIAKESARQLREDVIARNLVRGA